VQLTITAFSTFLLYSLSLQSLMLVFLLLISMHITVVTYYGTQNERAMLRYELRTGPCPDVILSTYTIFERESNKSDRAFMNSLHFEYLVLDEAHCIKNAQSSRFNNLNMLKTKHRLLLSGTPVQNDISELLSMLSFLMPQVRCAFCCCLCAFCGLFVCMCVVLL